MNFALTPILGACNQWICGLGHSLSQPFNYSNDLLFVSYYMFARTQIIQKKLTVSHKMKLKLIMKVYAIDNLFHPSLVCERDIMWLVMNGSTCIIPFLLKDALL